MKTGVYRTKYGNAAVVVYTYLYAAYDLDSESVIPMEMVTRELIRGAGESEIALATDAIEEA